MNEKLVKALHALCEGWRAGAQEIRDDCKARVGVVSHEAELGASCLESCAKRIEAILEAVKNDSSSPTPHQ